MDDSAAANHAPSETVEDSSPPKPFWAACGLFALYALSMIGLALATSNPVLINSRQVDQSKLVFVGEVQKVSGTEADFQVKELLKGDWDQETIVVKGFRPEQISQGEIWVIPAIFDPSGVTQITPLDFSPNAKPTSLIYPADAKTLDNLKSRLSSDENSP